jgi:tubulin polyglutamylase TTLL4
MKKNYLASEYIANPHLINGFKYDLRVYILVSSYDPLKIYQFKDGLVRFATEQYNTKNTNIGKRYIHLTNYSVNKNNVGFEIILIF